jgi:hypothetical protein
MTEEDFAYYFEQHGWPENAEPVPAQDIAVLSVDMPPLYGVLLKKYGTFTLRRGMLHVVRTDRFASLAEMLFQGDHDFGDGKAKVFCYSVFGSIYFWHPVHGLGFADLVKGEVTCLDLTSSDSGPAEFFFGPFGVPFSMENESYDLFDDQDKLLFKRALKKLGPPGSMECYGFVPALAFGGEARLKSLKKLSAPEHFAILAQSIDFTLFHTDDFGALVPVRKIGS